MESKLKRISQDVRAYRGDRQNFIGRNAPPTQASPNALSSCSVSHCASPSRVGPRASAGLFAADSVEFPIADSHPEQLDNNLCSSQQTLVDSSSRAFYKDGSEIKQFFPPIDLDESEDEDFEWSESAYSCASRRGFGAYDKHSGEKVGGASNCRETEPIVLSDSPVPNYGGRDEEKGLRKRDHESRADWWNARKHGISAHACLEVVGCLGIAVLLVISVFLYLFVFSNRVVSNFIHPNNATAT